MKKIPFFINSNLCVNKNDVSSFSMFMDSVAGNTGNSYITYALIKTIYGSIETLNHIQNIYTYDFSTQERDIDFINNNCSEVFLILQDQIRIAESYGLQLPYKKIQNFVSKLNKPVIIAGLGANSFNGFDKDFHKKLKPELIDFLKFLSDHCKKIGIRGHYTEEILHNIGVKNVSVIGCPSYYEMGANRILKKQKNIALSDILLTSFFHMQTLAYNYQIMQDYQEQKFITPAAFANFDAELIPFELNKLKEQKYKIFSNIETWKSFVSKFKFAIGYRLHGAILSINSGVPAYCCNPDSRATEMCNYLKIPHAVNATDDELIDLYNSIDIDLINNSYVELYDKYIKFLNENGITPTQNKQNKDVINFSNLKLYDKKFWFNFLKLKITTFITKKYTALSNWLKKNTSKIEHEVKFLLLYFKRMMY